MATFFFLGKEKSVIFRLSGNTLLAIQYISWSEQEKSHLVKSYFSLSRINVNFYGFQNLYSYSVLNCKFSLYGSTLSCCFAYDVMVSM